MGNAAPSIQERCSDVESAASPSRSRSGPKGGDQVAYWHEKMRESDASQDLFDASVRGDMKAAMLALVAHGNPNCCNADGLTSLMVAAAGGHLELVRLLVTGSAKVNAAPCPWGLSPLSLAAAQGSLEVVQLLLQWKAEPNTGAASGNAPLSRAAASGHTQVCAALLKQAADPNACDRSGATAAMKAAEGERLEALQLLIRNGASMARADRESRSALSRVADLLLRMETHGKVAGLRSPLSSYDYWAEMVSIMVEHNADINIVDASGDTLLCRAVRWRRKDVVMTLLDHKADIDMPVPSLNGGTAMTMAATEGDQGICEGLIGRSASVNRPAANGLTPLCVAIEKGREDLGIFLVSYGAEFNGRDPRTGETLLMAAAMRGSRRLYDQMLPHVPLPAAAQGHAPALPDEDGQEYQYIGQAEEQD